MKLARLAARQRDNLASAQAAEVPQGGVSHEPGRARDNNFLIGHSKTPDAIGPLLLTDGGRPGQLVAPHFATAFRDRPA
jgi:hypothetical protein